MSYLKDIQDFILDWNIENPVDHWWRTRYDIPFGSPSHLDMDMINMRVAYEEMATYKRISDEMERRKEEEENKLLGINSSDKVILNMSKSEIDEDFENLDLTKFTSNNLEEPKEDV